MCVGVLILFGLWFNNKDLWFDTIHFCNNCISHFRFLFVFMFVSHFGIKAGYGIMCLKHEDSSLQGGQHTSN